MSFDSLVGNRALGRRLARMARSGSVPPSLLFSGPPGVGKLRAATTLAQALNCERNDGEACGTCTACLRIEGDGHPDVHILRPEGAGRQLKAEAVRQVVSETPFRPFEGRRRVSIFVEAERMNPTAANTLLKTLEEPPPWALLILISDNASALLPTILSRCQIYRFAPLSADDLAELLVSEHAIDREKATLLAALGRGSSSEALSFEQEPLTELRHEALSLAAVVVDGGPARELVPWSDALAKNKRLLLVLHLLMGMTRDAAAKHAGGSLVHRDLETEIEKLASRAPLSAWIEAHAFAEKALTDLRDRYLNKRITLERLLGQLASIHRSSAPIRSR